MTTYTSDCLSSFEISAIIIKRCQQLYDGYIPFLDEITVKQLKYDPIKIAQKELELGYIDYTLTRELPNKKIDKIKEG